MNAITIKDLFFSYDEKYLAINNVSFNIKKNTYVTIIGHNGSGKSTLSKLLIGILKTDKGEITINDKILNKKNIYDIHKMIGVVFQNPDNQFIGTTVAEDIAFGLENHCVPPYKIKEIILKCAKQVNMIDYLEYEPHNLSGGQKQRVAIASVLALNVPIVIFDEATSMLDPIGKLEIGNIIKELKSKFQKTVISITHNMDEVILSDYVIVMNQGKIALQGSPFEIFKHKNTIRKIGLELPTVLNIIEKLQNHNINITNVANFDELTKKLWALNLKK